jgi:hypothetical protein
MAAERWQEISPVDGKTPIHFLVGLLAGLSGLNSGLATVVVIGFEALLITLEEGRLDAAFERSTPQSYGNQAVNTAVGILGVWYGEHLKKRQREFVQMYSPPSSEVVAVNTQVPTTSVEPITEVSGVPWRI